MHKYAISDSIRQRALRRQGRAFGLDVIDAARAALVVIDMQNHFVAEGFPSEIPVARAIVPNINRMSTAVRAAGGTVVWIQTTAVGALELWGNRHKFGLSPDVAAKRLASLAEDAEGYKIYPLLEVRPDDLRVKKIKFSALNQGSCDLDAVLRKRGVDILLVAGAATNVCCDSTARDAVMLNYRVAMISDANATWTDDEHAAALNTFRAIFGDVMTTDEAIARLVAA